MKGRQQKHKLQLAARLTDKPSRNPKTAPRPNHYFICANNIIKTKTVKTFLNISEQPTFLCFNMFHPASLNKHPMNTGCPALKYSKRSQGLGLRPGTRSKQAVLLMKMGRSWEAKSALGEVQRAVREGKVGRGVLRGLIAAKLSIDMDCKAAKPEIAESMSTILLPGLKRSPLLTRERGGGNRPH